MSKTLPSLLVIFGWFTLNLHAKDLISNQLSMAIEELETKRSYRWVSESELEGQSGFRPGAMRGTTVADDMIALSISFGSRDLQTVIDGEKAAVTDRDGRWETIAMKDQGYSSGKSSASIARNVETPVEELKKLVPLLTFLRTEDDWIVGDLPANAAEDHLEIRRGGETVRRPTGIVRFRINHGSLTKYVVRAEAELVNEDRTNKVSRTKTIQLRDVGTAKWDVPDGASEALQRPIKKSEPRLSEAAEASLLKARGKRDIGVHDPSSIVKCDGEYWFFSTGTGIYSWHSQDLQTWKRGPRVFSGTATWVTEMIPSQRGHYWAPDIIELGDRYLLYYSVSSFGKNTSAIALASTTTLNPNDPAFGWTDEGIVIQSTRDDDFNAIDPALIQTQSGELWMSFGSFWSGLKLIRLDPQTGKRDAAVGKLHSIANYRQIEAPHIYQHDGWFYLFVNWGKCCSGVDSTYNIRVGRSRDITGPYLDKEGVDMANGGGTLLLESEGPFIGPGHANVLHEDDRYWLSCHYYDGTERGRSRLSIQELTWSEDGWPQVAEHPTSNLVPIREELTQESVR
ncbi:arabinan endo-1,5-alpha-L-arabinosidase [Rhodopirellula sp. JC740]|uniref:Arabinan endo-1,5-alpha-L-arabinosidase n=1 Tax=Rhodopirellula halodulae TaxID=2894198 RepID=A0ABS8NG03_9BACT|nr:arabinan endo-1,5-alpha-L-arabinosidase [Rhodopirellula sp. JC740]MCC9642471.1 arabinan endo-1,5-alpha-L-arabinosidase [Rhodopirellula sp. JC740]